MTDNQDNRRSYSRAGPWLVTLLALGSLALLAGCPAQNRSDTIEVEVRGNRRGGARATPAQIEAAAKQEGEFSWYTSLPQSVAEAFLGRFHQKYPEITPRLTRGSTFDMIAKVQNELAQGELKADALHVLDVGVFIQLKREGQLYEYNSPEYRKLPPQYKDDGYWGAMRLVAICMAYNPQRTKPEQAPRTWEDLLDPRWAGGNIAFKDARTAGSAYAQYYFLRDRYGSIFWERLGRQQPKILRSAQEIADALLSGEVALAGGMMGYKVYDEQQKGRPIEAVWPADGVPIVLGPLAIMERARHPNAAKLFLDFALSREGQTIFQNLAWSYSVRPDVRPLPGRPEISKMKQMTPLAGWEDYLDRQPQFRAEFSECFTLGD